MATDCMTSVLGQLNNNPSVLGSCDSKDYTCLCASPTFTNWYLSTLCINCHGGDLKDPLSFLTGLCSSFAASINASYPDSCSQYLGPADQTSSTGSPRTVATTSSGETIAVTILSSSSSPPVTPTPTPSSSLSATTVVLSMTTPSPIPSTESSSRISTITAIPIPHSHAFILSYQSTSVVSSSPTFSAFPNSTYTAASTPTPLSPLGESSSSTGTKLSMGAKVGIGTSVAVAGIAFLLLISWALWRRKRSQISSYRERGLGFAGRTGTSTTLTEIYHDENHQPGVYPSFRANGNMYRSHEDSQGYGVGNHARRPREKVGLVPSGRIREVNIDMHEEYRTSDFATPVSLHSGSESTSRDLNEVDTGSSYYRDQGHQGNGDEERFSVVRLHGGGDGTVGSPVRESYYTAVGTGMSGLDLGQSGLSQEELARLEDEERRIDEAIQESERRAQMRAERGSFG